MMISEISRSVKYARIGWHYFWWNFHVSLARFHDAQIEIVVHNWKSKYPK